MCRAGNKKWKHYIANLGTKQFIDELQTSDKNRTLMDSVNKGFGVYKCRGTWVCAEIAIHLAMWISPRFATEVVKLLANMGQNQLLESGGSNLLEGMLEDVEEEGSRVRTTAGILYAVTAPCYAAVKMGHWKGDLKSLKKRYKTYLTSDMQMATRFVENAAETEASMLNAFAQFRIDGEVFEKARWCDYVNFIYTS